jgi:hypothetical protein
MLNQQIMNQPQEQHLKPFYDHQANFSYPIDYFEESSLL